MSGIIIAGSLIGLIANGVDLRIEESRKGRSLVVETNHTLILGWSPRVPAIVRELVIANESESHAAVVVLAEQDKNEMEQALHEFIGDTRSTRIVCRSGEPWPPANLELANFAQAKSVVVMGGGSDAATVKALLAVRAVSRPAGAAPERLSSTSWRRWRTRDTATSLTSLFSDQLVVVNSDSVVAELTAQACRKQGFSYVFRELLQFEGDELYMSPFPQLDGHSYADCQLAFEKCSVVGYLDAGGTVRLNPPPQTLISAQDELIAIAEDDSTYVMSPTPVTGTLLPADTTAHPSGERRIVICGWSELGPRVVQELDEFFGAETTIVLLLDSDRVDVAGVSAQVVARNVNVEVNVLVGGPEAIAAHAAQRSFHEVIVLGYRDSESTDDADARTLLTLLAFRQVDRADVAAPPVRIVAELLDQRHSPLADAIGADDFIVSDELTSLMIAQLSERRELDAVFKDLFDREGASVELFDGARYGATHARTFADIVVTASAQGQSALGYRIASSNTVVVNPAKSAPLQLADGDEILVIADEVRPGDLGAASARTAVPAS